MLSELASLKLSFSLQITLTVVPAALYFLLLGLLNSQHRPQMMTARFDFILLVTAISPLCAAPLSLTGAGLWAICLIVAAAAAAILLLAPKPGQGWVLYNISLQDASRAIERAAAQSACAVRRQGERLHLDDGTVLRLSAFPMLRNVSLSVVSSGTRPDALRRFEAALASQVAGLEVVASPMAASLVLISTAMIVAPMVLLADRMPEMVRVLTDLLG